MPNSEALVQQLLTEFQYVRADVKTVKELLTGNGSPEKGIVVRLDRVEVAQKRHRFVIATIFTAFATAAAGAVVWALIGKPF